MNENWIIEDEITSVFDVGNKIFDGVWVRIFWSDALSTERFCCISIILIRFKNSIFLFKRIKIFVITL
jgi:hypothetical protein